MRKNLLTLDITIAKEIEHLLSSEGYIPGDKLPSERAFSELFSVNRQTVRSALGILVQERIIRSEERKGYFVEKPRIIKYTNPFSHDYYEDVSNLEYKLHSFEIIHCDPRLSEKMLLPRGSEIYRITKLVMENTIPVEIEISHIPCDAVTKLSKDELMLHSTSKVLKKYLKHDIENSNQKITLVYTNETESQLLDTELGTPVMKHKGFVYDNTGKLVIFFENIMRMERFAFIRKLSE